MPVKFALTCAQCNAPLPAVTERRGSFTCAHCGASTAFALSASEFALFTDGLPAEQGQGGAFTISGLEQTLAEGLSALSQQMDRSLRLTERMHRPQVEQSLREQRTQLAATIDQLAAQQANLEQQRRALRKRRNNWFIAALALGVVAVFADAFSLFLFVAICLLWGWLESRGRLNKLAAAEAQLVEASNRSCDALRLNISDCEQLLAEFAAHAQLRPPAPPKAA